MAKSSAIPVFFICFLVSCFQTKAQQKPDSLSTQPPVFKYRKAIITWPLSGFVYEKSGVFYGKYRLSHSTLYKIARLEPDPLKKQNLMVKLDKARKLSNRTAAILFPSILSMNVGFEFLIIGSATIGENSKLMAGGVIFTSTGITGMIISGRITSKRKKADRELVGLLNN